MVSDFKIAKNSLDASHQLNIHCGLLFPLIGMGRCVPSSSCSTLPSNIFTGSLSSAWTGVWLLTVLVADTLTSHVTISRLMSVRGSQRFAIGNRRNRDGMTSLGPVLPSPPPRGHRTSSLPQLASVTVERQYLLYSRCSRLLVQLQGRRVNARGSIGSAYARLRIIGIGGMHSEVRLRSDVNDAYLCFDQRGKLIVKQDVSADDTLCVFRELISGDHYTELQSTANAPWRVGFKPNGSPLRAENRLKSPRCNQFVKSRLTFEQHEQQRRRDQYMRKF